MKRIKLKFSAPNYKIIVCPFLMICLSLIVTGCPANLGAGQPPPKYTIADPNIFPGGSGYFMVVYEIHDQSRDATFCQKLDLQGNRLWEGNGIQLFPGSTGYARASDNRRAARNVPPVYIQKLDNGEFDLLAILSDGVWMQRMDADGRFLWTPGLLQSSPTDTYSPPPPSNSTLKQISRYRGIIPQFTEDNNGNIILAYQSGKVILQKISQDGELLWTTLADGEAPGTFEMIQDYDENILLAQIRGIQKYNIDSGKLVWPNLTKLPGTFSMYSSISIAGDGLGGCWVIWEKGGELGDQNPRSPGEWLATRIDADGQIVDQQCSAPAHAHQGNAITIPMPEYSAIFTFWPDDPENIPDGSGGYVIVWRIGAVFKVDDFKDDPRNHNQLSFSSVQRISAEGKLLWGDKGVRLDR